MVKSFQVIHDFVQYDLVLQPIEDELARRGWKIVKGKASSYNKEKVDGSISCQSGSWIHNKPPTSPSFLIFHGVSFIKNWQSSYDTWDYVIVPSKFFEDNLSGNVLGLGWPKGDYFLENKDKKEEFNKIIRDTHDIHDDKPIILFAPTYKKKSGDGFQKPGTPDMLMAIVNELPEYHVIYMPHQMCDWKNAYKDYDLQVKSDYTNKYDYLLGCDLMIGDVSSFVLEYAMLDKPIVLLNDVECPNYLKISKARFKECLDFGEVVDTDNIGSIGEVVSSSLLNPGKFTDRRVYWADKALGYCDGNSTKRIVDKIEEICG